MSNTHQQKFSHCLELSPHIPVVLHIPKDRFYHILPFTIQAPSFTPPRTQFLFLPQPHQSRIQNSGDRGQKGFNGRIDCFLKLSNFTFEGMGLKSGGLFLVPVYVLPMPNAMNKN